MEFEIPLEVTANHSPSVAINVDPYSWFTDKAGNILDPADSTNYKQINENIRKSFGAEQDQDDDVNEKSDDHGNKQADDDYDHENDGNDQGETD